MRLVLLSSAIALATGASGIAASEAIDVRHDPPLSNVRDRGKWTARLTSDRAAERTAAMRDLGRLGAENVDELRQLAANEDVNVRTAAIDVLTAWLRGDDEPRRAAARAALAELAQLHDRTGELAAWRVEAMERRVESQVLAEILQPESPNLVFT